MDDVASKPTKELVTGLFLEALRVRDERLNVLAAELLMRTGSGALPTLIREACDRNNRPDHRLRLLEVIGRIGPPFGEGFLDLNLLLRDRNAKIRNAVAELVGLGVGHPEAV